MKLLIRLRLCNALLRGFLMGEGVPYPKQEPLCSIAASHPCLCARCQLSQRQRRRQSTFSPKGSIILLHHNCLWARFTASTQGCMQSQTFCISRISPGATKAPHWPGEEGVQHRALGDSPRGGCAREPVGRAAEAPCSLAGPWLSFSCRVEVGIWGQQSVATGWHC